MAGKQQFRGGFWDWVRKPSYRRRAGEMLAEWLERRERTVELSDRQIRKRIKDLWDTEKVRWAELDLEQQGERAVPALMQALKESHFVPVQNRNVAEDHPLSRILDLLGEAGAAEAVPAIVPFLVQDDKDFRRWAAHAIGMIGSAECVEPFRIAMRDADEHVRCWTLMGVESGLKRRDVEETFASAVLHQVESLIASGEQVPSDAAYRIVLEIDRDRAVELLLSDRVLHADRRDLHTIIKELREHEVVIPAVAMKALMVVAKPRVQEFPNYYVYGEALLALARKDDPEAEALAREAVEWRSKRVSEDAAEALVICRGITNLWEQLWSREKEFGFENLNQAQRFAQACLYFDSEVCNGGVAQYYGNMCGTKARTALKGFEAFGAHEAARILESSMNLFGPQGPAQDEDGLSQQLARLDDDAFAAMEKLSDAYYKVDDETRILRLVYISEHAEEILE